MTDNALAPLLERVDQARDRIVPFLPEGQDPDRFMAMARRWLIEQPQIAACSAVSVLQAVSRAASSGLPPDPRFASLIVRRSKDGPPTASWSPTYVGWLSLVMASGHVKHVYAHVVRTEDDFEVELGSEPRIRHVPALVKAGDVVAAYAVAEMSAGGRVIELLTREDIDRIREASPAKKSGPWHTWFDEMARKSAIRRLTKKLPSSSIRSPAAGAPATPAHDPLTGELVHGPAPQHLSDADIAAGIDSVEPREHDDWLAAYDEAGA